MWRFIKPFELGLSIDGEARVAVKRYWPSRDNGCHRDL